MTQGLVFCAAGILVNWPPSRTPPKPFAHACDRARRLNFPDARRDVNHTQIRFRPCRAAVRHEPPRRRPQEGEQRTRTAAHTPPRRRTRRPVSGKSETFVFRCECDACGCESLRGTGLCGPTLAPSAGAGRCASCSWHWLLRAHAHCCFLCLSESPSRSRCTFCLEPREK